MALSPTGARIRPGTPFEVKLAKGKKLPHYMTPVGKPKSEPEPEPEPNTLSEMGKKPVKTGRETKTSTK